MTTTIWNLIIVIMLILLLIAITFFVVIFLLNKRKTKKMELKDNEKIKNIEINLIDNISKTIDNRFNQLLKDNETDLAKKQLELIKEFHRNQKDLEINLKNNFNSFEEELRKNILSNENSVFKVLKKDLNDSFNEIKNNQKENLDTIRQEVTNKLANNINENIKNEFSQTVEKINEVNKNISILEEVKNEIKDINDIFKNNKSIGVVGEKLLNDIISDHYGEDDSIDGMFKTQYKIKDNLIVDLAIFTHNADNKKIIIPVDSKFQASTYLNYLKNPNDKNLKEFTNQLDQRIKEIEKYITDESVIKKALMFIPSEAIYIFMISNDITRKLMEKNPQILFVSPTTIFWYIDQIKSLIRQSKSEDAFEKVKKYLNNVYISYNNMADNISKLIKQHNDNKKILMDIVTIFNKSYKQLTITAKAMDADKTKKDISKQLETITLFEEKID
ncbi:DNA recombination protein RmuC [Mycoplasma sp. 744]|uniref:DNA recombination protein RmuC n=1 Tax=Mycoplasma sp. 744 TaxID=3108531 RepID=UPI002B1DCD58|nr:DNA recombination protein RmuC [Mycoplasma sp. 744]MEA4115332.1 DNA recombination protein RmuC [Mycoplasma sp. 744]